MKWIKKLQSDTIKFSIYFILFFITTNGILDYYNRTVLKQHDAVAREVKAVQFTMQSIIRNLNNCDMGFRGYYIIPTEQLLNPYTEAVDTLPRLFTKIRTIVARQGLDPHKIKPVEEAYTKYFKLIDQMIAWHKEDNIAAIKEVMAKDPGFDVWIVYKTYNDTLEKEELAILEASQEKANTVMYISTVVRISLFVLGIPTLLILLFRLKKERKRRLQLFQELDENNKQYLFNPNTDGDDQLNEKRIIESLIYNLRKATEFISNIAKGNFEIRWEGLTDDNKEVNKENLVGELLQMKAQMIKVKEEDQVRLWATEGVSKFAELVRKHQDDVNTLSDKITSTVVKYLGANQASLFFVEEHENQERVLNLYGCYAFDRKKYLEKTIAPGEGLVGQTYLEKEVTYLTCLPPNYVSITSGLGEATPKCLAIVPLKFNDTVEGVLEIASFKAFQPYELEFLQKIGEIIASAILNLRSSTEMKRLMENLQSQSEEMKSQEEEMRQNMEELQATQEEMFRKAKEYQEMIARQELELSRVREENEALRKQVSA